jgi:hypothetical protein
LRYYPFASLGSHAEAIAGKLDSRVVRFIVALEVGQGCWMRCGGSAPVDYVLVVRRAHAKGDVVYQLRFMDAKHRTMKADAVDSAVVTTMAAMQEKAKAVHGGMARELRSLRTDASVEDYDPSHFLLFTNDPRAGDADDGCVGPRNFDWCPWTTLLYADVIVSCSEVEDSASASQTS